MNYCYLCGKEIDSKIKSKEHIIPNAIGGKLKTYSALCINHNSKLGKEIDEKFIEIFSHISKLIPITTDRSANNKFQGQHIEHNIDVTITKNKTTPRKVSFNKETLTLYAPNQEQLDQYKIKLKNDGYDLKNIKVITEINDGSVTTFTGFDNQVFKQGFAKIAAGFASYKGVKAEQLNLILNDGNFKDGITVLENLPDSTEVLKVPENQTDFYPFHVIALHSDFDSKILYCYIELFSKFKHYILLGSDFKDDIHEFYVYSVSKDISMDISDYIDLYPNYSKFNKTLKLEKFYKAKRILEYLDELNDAKENSDILKHLTFMDSLISNEYIEKYVNKKIIAKY